VQAVSIKHARTIATVLALVSLGACSSGEPASAEGNDSSQASAKGGDFPSMHVVQTVVMLADGQAQEQVEYQKALATCQKSGLPTRALGADEVTKVGQRRVETWLSGGQEARHTEQWQQTLTSPCQFKLVHEDKLDISHADGSSWALDMAEHKGQKQNNGAPAAPAPLDGSDGKLDDAARQGGFTTPGKDAVGGQSCQIWQSSTGDQACVWDGGRQWGFSADGRALAGSDGRPGSDDVVVLWTKPAKGTGWQLKTDEMSVGASVGDAAFKVPANVAVDAAQ